MLGLDVRESAICKFLKKIRFSCQKLGLYALQRDETLRQQYVTDITIYPHETLIFVDETGTERKGTLRKYGYSLRGKPLKAQRLLVHGEHLSCIVAMSLDGIVAIKVTSGSVDGDIFYDFVCTSRLPKLMPFNGKGK